MNLPVTMLCNQHLFSGVANYELNILKFIDSFSLSGGKSMAFCRRPTFILLKNIIVPYFKDKLKLGEIERKFTKTIRWKSLSRNKEQFGVKNKNNPP